jgi:hypothetical protein
LIRDMPFIHRYFLYLILRPIFKKITNMKRTFLTTPPPK